MIRGSSLRKSSLILLALLALAIDSARAQEDWEKGMELHQQRCASCHGLLPKPNDLKIGADTARIRRALGLESGIPPQPGMGNLGISEADIPLLAKYLESPISATKSTVPFGETVLGASPAGVAIVATNYSRATLGAATVRASVSDEVNYQVSPSNCPELIGGASCSLTLTFKPQSAGTFDKRTLTIGVDGFPSRVIQVSGSARAPIELSTGTLAPRAVVGKPTLATVAVTNRTNGSVALSWKVEDAQFSAEYPDADAPAGAPPPRCQQAGQLAANATCTIALNFTPTSADPTLRPARLLITHSALPTNNVEVVELNGTAHVEEQATLQADQNALSFAKTSVGSSRSLTISLNNIGTANSVLQLTEVEVSGPFARSGSCAPGASLPLNVPCTLTITFTPSAPGSSGGQVRISHTGVNSPTTIALSGTGGHALSAALTPAEGLSFGAQTVAGLYPARTMRLINDGTEALNVASVVVEGAAFSNVGNACPSPLAPDAACDIAIRFAAPAAGIAFSGTVRVTTNASNSPHTATLSGTGTSAAVPVLTWSPAVEKLDFGSVSVGSLSEVKSIDLFNSGPGGAVLSLLNTIGTDSAMFVVASGGTNACSNGLQVFEKASCSIGVRFAPGGNGARSATLQVASSGSPPPTLSLNGVGLSASSPTLRLAPAALTLEATRVGSVSAPAQVTVQSAGPGPLAVTRIGIGGPFSMASNGCPQPPFSLAVGASCSLGIAFAPAVEGPADGSLTIESDASPPSQSVRLSAQAEPRFKDGGGGCSMIHGRPPFDPTLWVLSLMSMLALCIRRRRSKSRRRA